MVKEKLRAQILNGALTDYKQYMAGNYRGYYIVVNFQHPYYLVNVHATAQNEDITAELQTFLSQQQKAIRLLVKSEIRNNSILMYVSTPNLAKNLPKVLNEAIEALIGKLVNMGCTSGCGNCGDTDVALSQYGVNGTHHYLCDSCAKEIEANLQEQQINKMTTKSQFVPGLVGAFLGALIGAVLWILIYKLGYIAGIAGAVTAICAFKGYEMFGKHLDKKGVFTSIIIVILVIFFANRLAWSWEAYDALKSYGYTFADIHRSLGEILEASELTASYYGDLVMGYVLTVLCSIGTIIRTYKNSVGSYTVKKMQ